MRPKNFQFKSEWNKKTKDGNDYPQQWGWEMSRQWRRMIDDDDDDDLLSIYTLKMLSIIQQKEILNR